VLPGHGHHLQTQIAISPGGIVGFGGRQPAAQVLRSLEVHEILVGVAAPGQVPELRARRLHGGRVVRDIHQRILSPVAVVTYVERVPLPRRSSRRIVRGQARHSPVLRRL